MCNGFRISKMSFLIPSTTYYNDAKLAQLSTKYYIIYIDFTNVASIHNTLFQICPKAEQINIKYSETHNIYLKYVNVLKI